jgi:hypothetical protein
VRTLSEQIIVLEIASKTFSNGIQTGAKAAGHGHSFLLSSSLHGSGTTRVNICISIGALRASHIARCEFPLQHAVVLLHQLCPHVVSVELAPYPSLPLPAHLCALGRIVEQAAHGFRQRCRVPYRYQ